MGFLFWTVFVGITGWGVALMMRSDASAHPVLHIMIGICGALLGSWLMAMPVSASKLGNNEVSLLSLLASFFIALAMSMIVNLWERVSAYDDAEIDT